jgi:hypothetical protein
VNCRCGRENDARRCYCGACGRRIGKACTRCQFVNSTDDAFCGGCGDAIEAATAPIVSATLVDPPTAPIRNPAPVVARTANSADNLSSAELAALIGKAASPAPAALPAIVSQDDLDRLFGSVS